MGSNRSSAIEFQGGVTLPPPPASVRDNKPSPICMGALPVGSWGWPPCLQRLLQPFPLTLQFAPYHADSTRSQNRQTASIHRRSGGLTFYSSRSCPFLCHIIPPSCCSPIAPRARSYAKSLALVYPLPDPPPVSLNFPNILPQKLAEPRGYRRTGLWEACVSFSSALVSAIRSSMAF